MRDIADAVFWKGRKVVEKALICEGVGRSRGGGGRWGDDRRRGRRWRNEPPQSEGRHYGHDDDGVAERTPRDAERLWRRRSMFGLGIE